MFLCFHSCLVSVQFPVSSLLVVNFDGKFMPLVCVLFLLLLDRKLVKQYMQ